MMFLHNRILFVKNSILAMQKYNVPVQINKMV